jgi:hypothetical protein
MKKLIFGITTILLFVFVSAIVVIHVPHTDPEGAKRVLIESGYSNVSIGGYGWFSGEAGDAYRTNFTATSPNGMSVSGCVTHGMLSQSSTIRLN